MIVRSFLLSILAVGLAACGRGGLAADLNAPIQLAPGESAAFSQQNLEVHFAGIEVDSRCPIDVTCVWAGEVIVQLAVRNDGKTAQHSIKESQSSVVDGYTVTVLQVLPARTSTQRIAPADYRVTLKVAR